MAFLITERMLTVLLVLVSIFMDPSVARYVDVRQAPTPTSTSPPTQASANAALCATPDLTSESGANAALDRGVSFFLNDVLTMDFLPNTNNGNNMTGWFQYVWTKVQPTIDNVAPEGCFTMGGTCPVYANCAEVMELFWTQNTITQFYIYLNIFNDAFVDATFKVLGLVSQVTADFPMQVPVVSETTFLNNFGAALSILGGGVGLLRGENPAAALGGGFLAIVGSVFSDVGSQLQTGTPNGQADLGARLSKVFSQYTNNTGNLLNAVIEHGDLSAYPSRVLSRSQYNNSLVAFFDTENSFLPNDGFTDQALTPLISNQLLMAITGAAVLEANYYILKDAYTVGDCPTGQNITGVVIDNSCFTLEKAGQGLQQTGQSTRSAFSNEMDPATVGNLVTRYYVGLSDLYTSSYSCQNATNAYGTPLDFSTLDFNITGIPPCFYNLPVFQVSPSTILSTVANTPCSLFEANSTASTPEVGLTFFPDNLSPIFTRDFCTKAGVTPH